MTYDTSATSDIPPTKFPKRTATRSTARRPSPIGNDRPRAHAHTGDKKYMVAMEWSNPIANNALRGHAMARLLSMMFLAFTGHHTAREART